MIIFGSFVTCAGKQGFVKNGRLPKVEGDMISQCDEQIRKQNKNKVYIDENGNIKVNENKNKNSYEICDESGKAAPLQNINTQNESLDSTQNNNDSDKDDSSDKKAIVVPKKDKSNRQKDGLKSCLKKRVDIKGAKNRKKVIFDQKVKIRIIECEEVPTSMISDSEKYRMKSESAAEIKKLKNKKNKSYNKKLEINGNMVAEIENSVSDEQVSDRIDRKKTKSSSSSDSKRKMIVDKYSIEERGQRNTLSYRIFFKQGENVINPWHDIPLFADEGRKIYNMIVEIPRFTNAKMEMATKEAGAPIKQDEKKGIARFVHNVFPFKGYPWNYGALSQTWEDPNHVDAHTGAKGDNDPIDVIEIGSKQHKAGSVVQVKVLGVVALLDEGETDWKIIAIDVNDPKANEVNDVADVNKVFPGVISHSVQWFSVYKVPTGKPLNTFAFDGQAQSAEFAHKVIAETHEFWKALIKESSPKLNTECFQIGAAFEADNSKFNALPGAHPPHTNAAEYPSTVDDVFYYNGSQ
uniref:inorganic diphosphatase n=1 Tax=Parastrongyloides trichosuri TaxID=131310 RepID=A0A0N5A6M7_PARTI